jgi:ribosome-associated protein
MSNPQIKKLLKTVFKACQDVKGKDICVLDFTPLESYTDYVVLVSGSSDRQVRALGDAVSGRVKKELGLHAIGSEGYENGQWVLIDFGDVVCHIFYEEARKVYRLENMWPQVVPIPEGKVPLLYAIRKSRTRATQKPKKVVMRKAK